MRKLPIRPEVTVSKRSSKALIPSDDNLYNPESWKDRRDLGERLIDSLLANWMLPAYTPLWGDIVFKKETLSDGLVVRCNTTVVEDSSGGYIASNTSGGAIGVSGIAYTKLNPGGAIIIPTEPVSKTGTIESIIERTLACVLAIESRVIETKRCPDCGCFMRHISSDKLYCIDCLLVKEIKNE